MKTRSYLLTMVLLLCLSLSGCNKDAVEGSEVLTRVCAYFPNAEIYKFDKRVLWIQTNVDGVSSKTARIMFENACQQAKFDLGNLIKFNIVNLMQIDNREILVVGFKQYAVAWVVSNGVD